MITLDQDDLNALHSYAIEHGPQWKAALAIDWYHARAEGMRGSVLHGLRNNLGPAWLDGFQFETPLEFPNLRKVRQAELRTMNVALHMHCWNNTEEENLRMWAAKRELRRRASR